MSRNWLDSLTPEDLSFLRRFVLNSGSLKAVASEYGISYPTVRLRLDRLIEKIRIWESLQPMSEFERTLRTLAVDGRLEPSVLSVIQAAHEHEIRQLAPSPPAVREQSGSNSSSDSAGNAASANRLSDRDAINSQSDDPLRPPA